MLTTSTLLGKSSDAPEGTDHGFLDSGGTFTSLGYPGASSTLAFGINNSGQIVGYYEDATGTHSFLANPSPVMLDVVAQKNLATLSGTAEGNSAVSIFDGTKLIGTVTADTSGNWSLQANISGTSVHQFTETSMDVAGNTGSSSGVTVYSPGTNKKLGRWQRKRLPDCWSQ